MAKLSNQKNTKNAQRLRREMTKEERHLWYDFLKPCDIPAHRQKTIGPYIVDFYISSAKLVIELDGSQHFEKTGQVADEERDAYLKGLGLTVLRYANSELHENFRGVCEDILLQIREQKTEQREPLIRHGFAATPSPKGEGFSRSTKMKITCIQMDMLLGKPEENFAHAEELIEQAVKQQPDVIVLPETWNVGFFPRENLSALADEDGKAVTARIGALAAKYGVNIVAGSVANRKNGGVYNSAYVFDRKGGVVAEYDKTHLFTPSGEHEFFRKGDRLCRFTLDGVPCGLIICYDIRFPELTRSLTVQGVDLLFVVAQWPNVRTAHLLALSKARAIENQMFLVCCNSCGTAGKTTCGGNSSVHDPWGECLAQAGEGEQLLSADLDFGVVKGIRESINVFRDRRPELYSVES